MIAEIVGAAVVDPAEPISVDTETTSVSDLWRGSVIRGISVGVGDRTWYLPVTYPGGYDRSYIAALFEELADPRRTWVWHHAPYDWAMFASHLGIEARDLAGAHWDTQVGAFLEDENEPVGLKERAQLVFGRDAGDEKRALSALQKGPTLAQLEDWHYYGPEGREAACLNPEALTDFEPAEPPRYRRQPMGISREEAKRRAHADPRHGYREMWELSYEEIRPYAEQDARLTLDLFNYQRSLNHREDIGRAMPREMRYQRCIYDMTRVGIRVDRAGADASYQAAQLRMAELRAVFDEAGVNPNAAHQVAHWLYVDGGLECPKLTDKGGQSADKESLQLLGDDPRARAVLEWRRLRDASVRYFAPLLEALDDDDRVHPGLKVGTVTGRLSCVSPNLLTIPREDTMAEVRAVFRPAPGYELWEYDLSQAELRLAAAYAREQWLAAAFAAGRDIYQELANRMLRCRCPRNAKGQCPAHRQVTKAVALSYQYGAGAAKVAAILNRGSGRALTPGDVRRAEVLLWEYEKVVPALARTRQWGAELARRDGRIPLHPPGRWRHFRGFRTHHDQYKDAFNSWCQGGTAELLKDLEIQAWPELEAAGARCLLAVHDSLVCEVPPGLGPKVGAMLQAVVDDVNPFSSVRQLIEAKQWR